MEGLVLNESEFNLRIKEIYKEEQIKYLNEKWPTLNKKEKTFVIEFYKSIYPEKSELINESKWYNTLGDIVGIFDPTGLVDLVNGVSYWRQGDKLFALLSWISVIPYIGDVVAKPVVGVMKLGGEAVKGFRYAAAGTDAVKLAASAKNAGGPIAKFVEKSPSWGSKLVELLRSSVGKIPFIKKIVGLVEDYVKLFTTAGKEMKVGSELSKGLAVTEKETLKNTFRGFRDFGGYKNNYFKYISSKNVPLFDKFTSGVPRLLGGNPATRALMRKSKWYLGLLDNIGIVDSRTTPDELLKKYPNEIEKYNRSEAGQKNWSTDFGSEDVAQDSKIITPKPLSEPKTDKTDPFDLILGSLFR